MRKSFNLLHVAMMVSTTMMSQPAQAGELLRSVSFPAALEIGVLRTGEVIADGTLRVTADPDQLFRLLFEMDDPGISTPVYALKGMIRYENVEGQGYLQMDNHFGERGVFFTKSLAQGGPLRALSGSSDWRVFVLPFYAQGSDQSKEAVLTPEKLTLSLYLPGSGTVFLREVALHQYAVGEDPLQGDGQWLGSRAAILFGAIGGSLVGLWGAIVGVLASRGKARRFVLGSANVLIVAGILSLGAGLAALAAGQPYEVYYPLLLIGILLVFVVGSLRRALPRRYEALELKKMQAQDV
jgi:hypothetical protein